MYADIIGEIIKSKAKLGEKNSKILDVLLKPFLKSLVALTYALYGSFEDNDLNKFIETDKMIYDAYFDEETGQLKLDKKLTFEDHKKLLRNAGL